MSRSGDPEGHRPREQLPLAEGVWKLLGQLTAYSASGKLPGQLTAYSASGKLPGQLTAYSASGQLESGWPSATSPRYSASAGLAPGLGRRRGDEVRGAVWKMQNATGILGQQPAP